MQPPIEGPFARALDAGRARYNALFAQARRALPRLDAGVFTEHLRGSVAPIVDAVAGVAPDAVPAVTEALYELSLELVGKDLLGPRARHRELPESWAVLLRGLPGHLAAAPRLFAGAAANALYHLCTAEGGRPRQWAQEMLRLGALCPEPPVLLEAGKVAAWRAGLAHYRDGALDVCARLEPAVALAALGARTGAVESILRRLQADPWQEPGAKARDRRLRVVARLGAFRGFGGLFLRPPAVACAGGRLYVSDGAGCWQLCADVFGASFHRVGHELPQDEPGPFRLGRDGTVERKGHVEHFPALAGSSGFASNASTLCVTSELSHAVVLLALARGAP